VRTRRALLYLVIALLALGLSAWIAVASLTP
jgi:hypothetical protein